MYSTAAQKIDLTLTLTLILTPNPHQVLYAAQKIASAAGCKHTCFQAQHALLYLVCCAYCGTTQCFQVPT